MFPQKVNSLLHKSRILISAAFFLIILYFLLFTWLTVPPVIFFLGWHPDTVFSVLPTIVEEKYAQYVQPGDIILEIDGRPTQRGTLIFTPPLKASYDFTIQRGDIVFEQKIPIFDSSLSWLWSLSDTILSLAIWFVGFLTVQFSYREHLQPLYVGFGFQMIAAGIVSPGPSQLGAPGGWLVGQVLIFFFPLIILYLGFVPYNKPLNSFSQKLLLGSFCVLTVFALLSAFEVLFLYPDGSYQSLTGVGISTILTILAGVSIIAALATLLIRLLHTPRLSYERQQIALIFVFLTLAITPLFCFVILPVERYLFIPFPLVYSLFLIAPAGYFFVLHRQGYLALDSIFSRMLALFVLTLAAIMAYVTGTYLLDEILHINLTNAGQGSFIFLLMGVSVTNQKRVQSFVNILLYGHEQLGKEFVQEAKSKLAVNPELATVQEVVLFVSNRLNVHQVAVLMKNQAGYSLIAGNVPAFTVVPSYLYSVVRLHMRDFNIMASLPDWVDLSIPIAVRGDTLGLFLLSRPVNAYFNAQQVQTLQDIADTLAFSLLVISLVESMQTLSQQALYEREIQRQQIATEIHNEPLHTLSLILQQLQGKKSEEHFQETTQAIRQVAKNLRRIISGLRPPALKESIEWMTQQVVRDFEETYPEISISLQININDERRAEDPIKLAFYYILTEALNNVSKHSKATQVNITLWDGDNRLFLEVKDNGVGGIIPSLSLTDLLRGHHVGIADMYRWASIGNGHLEISPTTPTGITVKLSLPTGYENAPNPAKRQLFAN